MNGAKGGKASAQSQAHFPISKARAIRQTRLAIRRRQQEAEAAGRPVTRQRFLPLE